MSGIKTPIPVAPGSTPDGNRACNNTVEPCPNKKPGKPKVEKEAQRQNCPIDFKVEAKCKIVCVDGGKIQLKVSDLDGFSGGTFTWTTSSGKVRLNHPNSSTVTVEALSDVSTNKDAEIIKVTRTSPDCRSIEKTVRITVAKVVFSESGKQRYGYDNFDTAADSTDDHICIKKSDHTFVQVTIEGGLVGTDFEFKCSDNSVCKPDPATGSAKFDLKLNAGSTNKKDTELKALAICNSSMEFAKLSVHVYKERIVNVIVAKIDHPTKVHLRFPTADYAAHQSDANKKLKEGVVKYNIENFDPKNNTTKVTFKSGTGVLNYDIAAGGGDDLKAIQKAMTGTGSKVRVAIIRDMKSYYYTTSPVALYHLSTPAAVYNLDKDVKKGDTRLTITESSTVFKVGDKIQLDSGGNEETITITAVNGKNISCRALAKDHHRGANVGSNTFQVKEAGVIQSR